MENGRIAIPSNDEGGLEAQRSGHFGHCDVFTLVDVKDGKIENIEVVANQEHSEGGCLVPVRFLASLRVNALVVAGMGMRPLLGFNEVGIDVYFDNVEPFVKPVVDSLIAGKLQIMNPQSTCGGGSGGCH